MIISFPQLSDYYIPIERMLKSILPDATILVAPPISKKTLELGSKHSPEFVCSPFKYNLGNFIEALENGADVLFQAGGGCRYGYYAELQEQILRDLGYNFKFINLFESGKINPFKLLKIIRGLGGRISLYRLLYYLLLTVKMIRLMDDLDMYMRQNIGFEAKENTFLNLQRAFYAELKNVTTFKQLNKISKEYTSKYKNVKTIKPDKPLRVGIVGELYNLMEPFANHFIEKELAKNHIEISRYTNVTYLLFQKKRLENKTIADAGKYLKYALGADGTLSVSKSKIMAECGYDGIIHVKPFGCTPELNAMPMLMNINKDYKIPVLYFSFDCETSETGVKTRLEAFCDMLLFKRQGGQPCNKSI